MGIVKQDDKTPNLNNIKNGEAVQSKAVIRRIPIEQVPCDDENKCAEFLQKLYVEKVNYKNNLHLKHILKKRNTLLFKLI